MLFTQLCHIRLNQMLGIWIGVLLAEKSLVETGYDEDKLEGMKD